MTQIDQAKRLVMDETQQPINLNTSTVDYIVTSLKAISGVFPGGSLVAELVGTVIPKQRMDRFAKFCEVLNKRLEEIEQDFIHSQLTNENFIDLLEESFLQSVRSVTDERRKYIAALILNSLSSTDVDYIESKHLLRILGEINDIEVVLLRDHLTPIYGKDWEFKERHKDVLRPIRTTAASKQEDIDKRTLWESYRNHLHSLNLLDPVYETDGLTGQPKFEKHTGRMKIHRYELTRLGNLLLRHLDLIGEMGQKNDGGKGLVDQVD